MAQSSENQFGKYELQGRIAAGGMAEIFRARYSAAAGVTKQVVIKRILPHYAANKSFIQMFTNEARIAMGLSHGNIAQVFDFGEIDGDWFLAMEYVDGQPLSKVLKRSRAMEIPSMPTAFACVICIELLKGLHYAHTRLDEHGKQLKIIHRDVSPQNVLISFEGQIKIVDFGIAKARHATREDTEAGAVKGKYTYFSPEQAKGKELDARTDIFAAGIILYEMLCGQLPFQGPMIQTMSKIVRGEFPQPRSVNPEITPALEKIMLTAMAHEKADRYQTAEAFQQALSSYLYQNAPSFQVSTLASFMGYLFEQELVADGRPVQLGRDFLDQISMWKKALPAPTAAESSVETAFARDPEKKAPRRSANGETPAPRSRPTGQAYNTREQSFRGFRTWSLPARIGALSVLPVGAAMLAALAVLVVGRMGTFSMQLTSQPSGASAVIDGHQVPQPTPVLISNLSKAEPHHVEVSAAGMKNWSRDFAPSKDDLLRVNAELQPLAPEPEPDPVPAAVPVPVAVAPAAPASPPVPMDATWPVPSFTVQTRNHSFLVPGSKAPKLVLDPKRSYRVWTEGKVSFGGFMDNIFITECAYFLEGGSAKDSFGMLSSKPTVIHNASALYAFVLDSKPDDNSGAMKVRVRDVKGGPTMTILVDSKEGSISFDTDQRFTVYGLSQLAEYTVTLKDGSPAARTRGERGGRVGKMLFAQQAGFSIIQGKSLANEVQRVFEVGKTYTISGAAWFWLAFPDDSPDDNSGAIEVEMTAIAGKGGGIFKR